MSRPADWSPIGRSHDPIPGQPDVVMATGRLYIGTADAILRAADNLTTALAESFGQAESIDAIRDQADDVARRIVRAEERYRGVGDAMVAYAPVLSDTQARSVAALNKAIEAQGRRQHAEQMADHYRQRLEDPATPPANLPYVRDRLQHWNHESGSSQLSMAGAEQDLHDAVVDRDMAAESALEAIQLVENSGDLNDSGWDNIVGWVKAHDELLDTIGTVLGTVAAVAGLVLLFVPGLNLIVAGILAAIVIANVAYQAINGGLQVASGTMTAGELILNVGLAVLNVVGIGATLKLALPAMRATAATSLMRSHAGAGIAGMTRAVADDVVTTVVQGATRGPTWARGALAIVGIDDLMTAPLYAVAGIRLLSGAAPTGVRIPMLIGLGVNGAVQAGGQLFGDPIARQIDRVVPTPQWRAGDDW